MGWYERISNAFRDAPVLPLDCSSHFVLFSDCHRGVGNSNDNFLKNQHLYLAALQHYFQKGYTYLELGDGDELWENHSLARIIDIHNDVFCLLREFYRRERLYMLYGNHDHCKKNVRYCRRHCSAFHCQNLSAQMPRWHITPGSGQPQCRQLISGSWQASHPFFSPDPVQGDKAELLPDFRFLPGLILRDTISQKEIYLTHGHQADFLNSTLAPLSGFLVRYFWKPLEAIGVSDPTSAARNYTKKHKTEMRLAEWASQEGKLLITGHTHRPMAGTPDSPYFNTGSCVHPSCITCIEIQKRRITLVKWTMKTKEDLSLYVAREELEPPVCLEIFPDLQTF